MQSIDVGQGVPATRRITEDKGTNAMGEHGRHAGASAGRRGRRFAAALVVVAAVATAGCGGDDDDDDSAAGTTPTTSGSAGPTDTSASSPDGTALDNTGEIDPAATLSYSFALPPGNIDPARPQTPYDMTYLRPAYDTLIERAPDGSLQPRLATSWEFVDGALQIDLRPGVVFHDGSPFDAQVVVDNIERTRTLEGGTQAGLLASVESVEVVDDDTVRFVLGEGGAELPGVLSTFPGIMVSPQALDGDLSQTMVGTGAYQLDAFDPATGVEYVPFANAWNPTDAGAARLRILNQVDSGQRLNQLRTGEVQAAQIDPNLVEAAENEGMQVIANPANNAWLVSFNATPGGPLESVEARRAINYVLDRAGMVDALDFGYATPQAQLQPENEPGHNPDVVPTFDPEQAAQLAEQSGLAGQTLRMYGAAIPTIRGYQEAIQAQLSAIGVNAEIVEIETARIADEVGAGGWDLYVHFYPGSADPWITYNALLASESLYFPATLPDEVSAVIEQVRTEFDPDARNQQLQDLAAAVQEHELIGVISSARRPAAALPNVVNFHGLTHVIAELRGTGIAPS